jgi:3-methyl-2-oxobutanoate hydroxymethyltransferase
VAKRRTITEIIEMAHAGQKLAMVTAYDFPMARLCQAAGVDMILVGDSLGMTVYGEPDTLAVTMDDMVRHAGAVVRGAPDTLVVADLPFLSYQVSVEQALLNAGRLMQTARVQAVKLEGGQAIADTIRRLVETGIPVMGHLGFTPQSVHQLGGFRLQAKGLEAARALLADARAVEAAGAFAIVLEMVPSEVARYVTRHLSVPTIGIGAGPHCSGQVLVLHDLIGLYAGRSPRFAKRYADMATTLEEAVRRYAEEVREGTFPGPSHQYAADPAVAAELAREDADT